MKTSVLLLGLLAILLSCGQSNGGPSGIAARGIINGKIDEENGSDPRVGMIYSSDKNRTFVNRCSGFHICKNETNSFIATALHCKNLEGDVDSGTLKRYFTVASPVKDPSDKANIPHNNPMEVEAFREIPDPSTTDKDGIWLGKLKVRMNSEPFEIASKHAFEMPTTKKGERDTIFSLVEGYGLAGAKDDGSFPVSQRFGYVELDDKMEPGAMGITYWSPSYVDDPTVLTQPAKGDSGGPGTDDSEKVAWLMTKAAQGDKTEMFSLSHYREQMFEKLAELGCKNDKAKVSVEVKVVDNKGQDTDKISVKNVSPAPLGKLDTKNNKASVDFLAGGSLFLTLVEAGKKANWEALDKNGDSVSCTEEPTCHFDLSSAPDPFKIKVIDKSEFGLFELLTGLSLLFLRRKVARGASPRSE